MNCLFSTPALNVFEQMALDEVLVRDRPAVLTLRFYHWPAGPAVTFGYAQFVQEVRRTLQMRQLNAPYARRPTGGGVVFHGKDLTFSLIFPSADRPSEIYKKLHGCIHAELGRVGLTGRLFAGHLPVSAYAPSVNHSASACFINPVENDLLADDGAKILGGAIRRFGTTVLYQGSLQTPHARTNPLYKTAVIQAVRNLFAADLRPCALSPHTLEAALQLAKEQYQTQAWTEKF